MLLGRREALLGLEADGLPPRLLPDRRRRRASSLAEHLAVTHQDGPDVGAGDQVPARTDRTLLGYRGGVAEVQQLQHHLGDDGPDGRVAAREAVGASHHHGPRLVLGKVWPAAGASEPDERFL